MGSPLTPGLYTEEQIEAWKKITQAVHDKGGIIFAQLWHAGRVGHSIDRKGNLPVSASSVAIQGKQHFTSQGTKDYEAPRTLTIEEIKQTIRDYRQAALNAIEAGFDGVELHAGNGYLPEQFLAESANQRKDQYGGSIENKSKFILEIMEELIEAVGGERVGIKISPLHSYADIVHENPTETYTYLISELNKLTFAFVELMRGNNPAFPRPSHYPDTDEITLLGSLVKTTLIANSGYTRETGEAELEKGIAKLISYGTLFLANPDLPKRFELNSEFNTVDKETMYGGREKGYTDYPFL
nr:alkene reductase [Olivibacter sp. SDN3]